MKMLSDSSFSLAEIGGKKGFIHNVTGRKGLPEGTKIHAMVGGALARKIEILEVNS